MQDNTTGDKNNSVWDSLAGGARYYRRLGIELAVIYGVSKAAGIDPNHAALITGHYGILRNGIDGLDAIIFKYGRMHDYISQGPSPPSKTP